jgi:GNAT superfamily N-acetyltransferase
VHSPALIRAMFDFDEDKKRKSADFIASILRECFNAKHLHVAVSHGDGELYGYALMFIHPNETTRYLHKIFVHEQFRRQKIGSNLLEAATKGEHTTALLCSTDVEGFYEKKGFRYVQEFKIPDSDQFTLSKHLYYGLVFMANGEGFMKAPVFLLNDQDIRRIMGIVYS